MVSVGRVHHINSGKRLENVVGNRQADGQALRIDSQGLKLKSASPHQKFTYSQIEKLLARKKFTVHDLPTSPGKRFEIGKQTDPKRYSIRIDPQDAKATFVKYDRNGKTSAEFQVKLDSEYDQTIIADSIAGQIHALLSPQVEEVPSEQIIRFPGMAREQQRDFHLPDIEAA